MKKRILMLGAGFMQGVAIRCARSRGWEVVAVDGNPDAVCASLADRFEPIDLKDREALAALALSLQQQGGLDGVFTAATDFSASVAWVAQKCGLEGHSFEAALNASDKLRMRACFDRDGVPSPAFVGIDQSTRADLFDLMTEKDIQFPVVVKPVDNMGARGCRKVESAEYLDAAIDDAIRYSRNGNVIVEEFMDGPEFSVEGLVFDGELHMTGFADRHIFFPPYFIEMGHTIPTDIPDADQAALVSVFHRGVKSLGLTHGTVKGDMKLTRKGPMVGEIAGRLSGGYMSGWTFPYSSGIDLTGAALDLAVGGRPGSLVPSKDWTCAERAWISIPGKVAAVSGYEKARSIPFVTDVFPRSNPGDAAGFPLNNVEKSGNCLASAPDRRQAVEAAESACRAIFLRLDAPDKATEAFLARPACDSSSFPPDAFAVPQAVFGGLSANRVTVSGLPIPVPAILVSYLDTTRDWQGRTFREALLQALDIEPGLLALFAEKDGKNAHTAWKALLRGGIQGIVYIYDRDRK